MDMFSWGTSPTLIFVYAAIHTRSRRFLQSSDDNFDTGREVYSGPFTNIHRRTSWGCEGWGQPQLQWPRAGGVPDPMWKKQSNKQDYNLLGRIPQARAPESRGSQVSLLIFKHHWLQAQDQCIPMSKKSSKGDSRPAWMSRLLLENSVGRRKFIEHGKRDCHLRGIQECYQSMQGCHGEG